MGPPAGVPRACVGRPFDLLELGPSAGLNLLWDRYRYRYSSGTWGSGRLELTGDDRVPPPAELLRREVSVVRRRGVDLNPVDVTTEHGARLLQAFVWADQTRRLERLRSAIDVLREDPPELDARRLRRRAAGAAARAGPDADLVVFQTASTMYLEPTGRSGSGPRCTARDASSRSSSSRPGARPTTTVSRSRWSGSRTAARGGSPCSTSTASGSSGGADHRSRASNDAR